MSAPEIFDGEENPPPQDNLERGSNDGETCCSSCRILSKKLRSSREWNRFYQMKLENTDKLLHIVADYEREKQHNVELQLAYDQRTRESSYIREQMANLLLEIQPLREKLRVLEKRLEEEVKRRERAEDQEQGLRFSIEQMTHQLRCMREKVDTNLIEILEKKLAAARSEIKRLKSIIDDKSCEVSELKDFNADRRLHYERNNKKALWSLKIANEYGTLLKEYGCLPRGQTSASWNRLQSLLEKSEGILQSQYQAFLRKQEKKYKKNSVEMADLPSLESWLDDFDVGLGDELFEEEDDSVVKNSQKKVLAKEAKQLEELIQDISDDEIGSKGGDKVHDYQDQQKTQGKSGLTCVRKLSSEPKLEDHTNVSITSSSSASSENPFEKKKMKFDILNNNNDSPDGLTLNQAGEDRTAHNLEGLPTDSKNDGTVFCGQVDSSEDIIRQILNDMKPHDKLDCLDSSFCLQDSEDSLHSEEKHRDRTGGDVDETQERDIDMDEDDIIGSVSDSSDDACHDVPKTLVSQVSQGFSVVDTTGEKVDSMLEDLGITDSDDSDEETLLTGKGTQLLQRFRNNFQSSQSFSVDIDPQDYASSSCSVSVEDHMRKDNCTSQDQGSRPVECLVEIKSERYGERVSHTSGIDLSEDDQEISSKDQLSEQNYTESNSSNDSGSCNSNMISDTEISFNKPNKTNGYVDGHEDDNLTNNMNDENRLTELESQNRNEGSEAVESVICNVNGNSQKSASTTNEISLSDCAPSNLTERDMFKEQNDKGSNNVCKDSDYSNIIDQLDAGKNSSKPRLQELRHLYNVVNDSGDIDEHEPDSVTMGMTNWEDHQHLKSLDNVNIDKTGKAELTETLETKHHNDNKKTSNVEGAIENIKLAYQKLHHQNQKLISKMNNAIVKGEGSAMHDCHESSRTRGYKNSLKGKSEQLLDKGGKEITYQDIQHTKDELQSENDSKSVMSKGNSGSCTGASAEEQESDTQSMFGKKSYRVSIEGACSLGEDQESNIMHASSEGLLGNYIENTDTADEDQVGIEEIMFPLLNGETNDSSIVYVNTHGLSSSCPDQGKRQSVKKQQKQQRLSSSSSKNDRTLLENPLAISPQNFDDSSVIDSKDEPNTYAEDRQQNLKVCKDTTRIGLHDESKSELSSSGTQGNDTSSTEVKNNTQRFWQSGTSCPTSEEKVKVDQDKKEREETPRILLEGRSITDDEIEMKDVNVLEKRVENIVNMRETTVIKRFDIENDDTDKDVQDGNLLIDTTSTEFGSEVEVCRFGKENVKDFSSTVQIVQSRNDEVLYTLEEKDSVDGSHCNSSNIEPTELSDNEIIEGKEIRKEDLEYVDQSLKNTNGHINAHQPGKFGYVVRKEQNINRRKRKLQSASPVREVLCSDQSLTTDNITKGELCSDSKRKVRMHKSSVRFGTGTEPGQIDPSCIDTYETLGYVSETDASQMSVWRRSSRRIAAMEKKKFRNQEKILQKFKAYRKKSDQFSGKNFDAQNAEDSPYMMNYKDKESEQCSIYKESHIQDTEDKIGTVMNSTREKSESSLELSRAKKPHNVNDKPARIVFNWGPKLQVHTKIHVEKNIKFFQKSKITSVVPDLYSNLTHNAFSVENRKRRAQKRSVSLSKVDVLWPEDHMSETTFDDISSDIFLKAEHGKCRSMKINNTHCRSTWRNAVDCSSMKESTKRNLKGRKRESGEMNIPPVERVAHHKFIEQPGTVTKRKGMERRSPPQAADKLRERDTKSLKNVELCTSKRKASQRSLFGTESSSNKNSSSCLDESPPLYKGPKQRNRRGEEEQGESRSSRGRRLKLHKNVELSRSINGKPESSGDRSSSPESSSSSQDSCRKLRNPPSKTNRHRFVKKSVKKRGNSFSQKKTSAKLVLAESDVYTKQNSSGGKSLIDSSDSEFSSDAQERIKHRMKKRRSCLVTSETDDLEMETSNVLSVSWKRYISMNNKTKLFRATNNSYSETEPKKIERRAKSLMLDDDGSVKNKQYSVGSLHGVKQTDFRHRQDSSSAPEPEASSVSWETRIERETVKQEKCIKSNKAKQVISCGDMNDLVVPRKESAFEVASRLSASHMKTQENKRTAILLDAAPQSASKRQRKKSLSKTPEKCHEDQAPQNLEKHHESQKLESPTYCQEKGKANSLLPEFDLSDTGGSHDELERENQYDSPGEKELIVSESTSLNRSLGSNSEEKHDACEGESSHGKYETQIVSHPGLVSSLARLGTLSRPKVKPKSVIKKTVPKAYVPASSGFVDSLFCKRIKDAKWNTSNDNTPEVVTSYQSVDSTMTSFDLPQGKVDDLEEDQGRNENINKPESSTLQVAPGLPPANQMNVSSEVVVPLPNMYGTVKNIPDVTQSQLPNLKHLPDASCSPNQGELEGESTGPVIPQEASHSLRKSEVVEALSQKQSFYSQPSLQPEKRSNSVVEPDTKVKNISEKSMQNQRHSISHLHSQTCNKELLASEIASIQEGEDCNYSEILEELSTCRIRSRLWITYISKLCRSLTAAQLLPFIRNCIEFILRADPNEHKEIMTGLPPTLYKLFQVICVLELRLDLPPLYIRSMILRIIHGLICKPSINLRPHSLACLTAWYTATVSIPDKSGVQQWEMARTFLVDLLLHHPGAVHLALLSAASTSKKIFLRMVKYRDGTALEKVLQWVAYYGVWTGCVHVRERLVAWLTKQIAVQKPPPEDPTTLAHNFLTQLTGTSGAAQMYNLVISIIVLACWLGRLWIQKHLLPAIMDVTAKCAVNGKSGTEEQDETGDPEDFEKQPKELISQVTLMIDHLGKILKTRHEANSHDGDTETKQDNVIVELNEAMLKLLRLQPITLGVTS